MFFLVIRRHRRRRELYAVGLSLLFNECNFTKRKEWGTFRIQTIKQFRMLEFHLIGAPFFCLKIIRNFQEEIKILRIGPVVTAPRFAPTLHNIQIICIRNNESRDGWNGR